MKIWMILVLTFAILLFGCLGKESVLPGQSQPSSENLQTGNQTIIFQINNTITVNSTEPTMVDLRQECVQAASTGLSLSDCYESLALEYNDPSLCSSDDRCITKVASKYNEVGYCELMILDRNRNNCLRGALDSKSQEEITLLEEMEVCDTEGDSMSCYTALAIQYDMPNLCDEAGGSGHDRCIYILATKYNKAGYCNLIDGYYEGSTRNECMEFFNLEE